jgi:hypothetical protein
MFTASSIEIFSSEYLEMQPFQLGVDIGSSTVARGVVSLVLGYLNNLVIEMAFLVQVIVVAYLTTSVTFFPLFHINCRRFECVSIHKSILVRLKVENGSDHKHPFFSFPHVGQHARRAPRVPFRHLPAELPRRLQSYIARRMLISEGGVSLTPILFRSLSTAQQKPKGSSHSFSRPYIPCRPQKHGPGLAAALYIHSFLLC